MALTPTSRKKYGSANRCADAHKPEKVWFSKSLREDLSRRDFTVNAMAMDINGRIYDYHNGMEDLQNHILRTVGDAGKIYKTIFCAP